MIVFGLILLIIAAGAALYCLFGSESFAGLVVSGVAVLVALCLIGMGVIRGSAKHVTFTVQEKTVVATSSDNGHEYQIFSTDGQVFADKDSFSFFKFDSSNVYGQLQVGHTYDCLVTGWRIPILSVKNNIIRCTEVSS